MSPISIDFSDIPSLEPIDPGTYPMEIVAAEEGESQTGNPKIDIRWKVLDGKYEGRVVFDNLSFAPNALWRTKLQLQALGWGKEFSGEITGEDLIGRIADVTVSKEIGRTNPDTGEAYPDRNRVLKVKPSSLTADDLLS